MALIAPSLLSADFARLGEALRFIQEAGASMVHVDVMDGHFVPEISVGQPVVKSLRKATNLVLDVHLLIERPERFIPEFIQIGADRVAIHAEATPNLHKALAMIRAGGALAGLALNPATALESVSEALGAIDYLLILSADPGLGNLEFLPGSIAKVQAASALRRDRRMSFAIQVEGGIGEEQIDALERAGADILVTGSDIFHKVPKTRLAEMMRPGQSSRPIPRA